MLVIAQEDYFRVVGRLKAFFGARCGLQMRLSRFLNLLLPIVKCSFGFGKIEPQAAE